MQFSNFAMFSNFLVEKSTKKIYDIFLVQTLFFLLELGPTFVLFERVGFSLSPCLLDDPFAADVK